MTQFLFTCKIKLIRDVYRCGWRKSSFTFISAEIYVPPVHHLQTFMGVPVEASYSYQLPWQFWGSSTPASFFSPLLFFLKYSFLSSPLRLPCFGHQSPLLAIFIYLVTLTLCEAEHFQSKPILRVPKDVILIYSLGPLNGAALTWQPFSRPGFKEHTILFLPRAFQSAGQGLSRSFNGCQSVSMLHFIHGCQGTWGAEEE